MERDYRPNQGPDDPDRRKILIWITIGTGGSVVTCLGLERLSNWLLSPLYPRDDDQRGIEAAATATKVAIEGRRTSFTPEGKFTEEIYQQVARSLVVLEIYQIGQPSKGGTGWCVAIPGSDEVVIVTAHHVLPRSQIDGSEQPSQVRVYHPISSTSAEATACRLKLENPYFVAMRLKLNKPLGVSPLSYQVRPLTPGTQVLTAGFSNQFLDRTDLRRSNIHASVTEIGSALDPYDSNLATAPAVHDHGSSGSPVVTVDGGIATVIGILISGVNIEGVDVNGFCPLNGLPDLLTRLS